MRVSIAAILGLELEQQVSKYNEFVIKSFENDILPFRFGMTTVHREQLVEKETSFFAKQLYNLTDQLPLIFDGTNVYHEKGSNNEYMRRSYSGQKKNRLCKPFTITTTNGFIVDTFGPFSSANENDAQILKQILEDANGLKSLMRKGDVCIVDRGFRDANENLRKQGHIVLMPALTGERQQLTTVEANDSRRISKVRSVVEAIHGQIEQKYHFLYHQVDNEILSRIRSYTRIACFLQNQFGRRVNSDTELRDEILAEMTNRQCTGNTLAVEVGKEHWDRRKVPFKRLTSAKVIDFPEMAERLENPFQWIVPTSTSSIVFDRNNGC